MTGTQDAGQHRRRRPHESHEPQEPDQPHPLAPPPSPRRRLPGWALVLAGLLVLVLVGALIALITSNRAEPEALPDVVVTLPAPSPTLDPIDRPATTPFAEGLPATVLQFALVEEAAEPALLLEGALEGHRLLYSDGAGNELVVLAGQWRDAEAAAAVFATRQAALEAAASAAADGVTDEEAPADGEATDEATPTDGADSADSAGGDEVPAGPQGGPVVVDGTEVGTYVIVPLPDGTGSALWHNGTAVVQVTGPADVLAEFFAAFPV